MVSQTTQKFEGAMFPQVTTIYRCSNQECQDERDKQTEIRIKAQESRNANDEKRKEEKIKTKLKIASAMKSSTE